MIREVKKETSLRADLGAELLAGFSLSLLNDDGDLERDSSLENMVLLSVFVDRQLPDHEPDLDGAGTRGGWVGDIQPTVPGDKIGSLIWTLFIKGKLTQKLAEQAAAFAEESLEWMIVDRIAKRMEVAGERLNTSTLGLEIKIFRGDKTEVFKYNYLWESQKIKRA